ncbi:MAG: nucleotidyltransferase [Gallionellales bacterium RIFCSPHIGHO2_02_FULL_57_16]|nr:MAG: nucleotidyltransferase [Gallionellales bacterium RIFCSPHIGHO2_02_FULL_57_16]
MYEPLEREWRFYVTDMIGFAEKVVAYTDGMDQERFVASGLNYDATVHNLILLGEAATHIPDHVRTFASEIDWRQIVGTRNRLVHGYVGINNDIVWDIIQDEIPVLIEQLYALKKSADENQVR